MTVVLPAPLTASAATVPLTVIAPAFLILPAFNLPLPLWLIAKIAVPGLSIPPANSKLPPVMAITSRVFAAVPDILALIVCVRRWRL